MCSEDATPLEAPEAPLEVPEASLPLAKMESKMWFNW